MTRQRGKLETINPFVMWGEAERQRREKEAEHEWRVFVERVRAALNEINNEEVKENA